MSKPKAYVLLGRHGDVIQMLPAFKRAAERDGQNPVVIVNLNYAPVFKAVSYANPIPVIDSWEHGTAHITDCARIDFGRENVTVLQWWLDEREARQVEQRFAEKGDVVVGRGGVKWRVDSLVWPNYTASMWERMGFTMQDLLASKLELDRRDEWAEAGLVARVRKGHGGKPLLLVNLVGLSSPFPAHPEVWNALQKFKERLQIVDLSRLEARHIQDLLGLYDVAAGLITVDTATLHLAAASKVPLIWFRQDGWQGSLVLWHRPVHSTYSRALQDLPHLLDVVEGWAA